MNKAQKRLFKSSISDNLKYFGKALFDAGLISNTGKFDNASLQCLDGPIPTIKGITIDYGNCWGYEIEDLPLIFDSKDAELEIFPENVDITSINISSRVIGKYTRDDYAEDPLSHLEFNLGVKGVNNGGDAFVASWHLDRHPDNSESVAAHPVYHFQYGGKNLILPNNNYGSHLVLDLPRLMHPPLDIILGVDFVLSNFFGHKRNNLCDVRTYALSVQNLQKLIWRPYTYSVARNWTPYPDDDSRYEWNCQQIYPQILRS